MGQINNDIYLVKVVGPAGERWDGIYDGTTLLVPQHARIYTSTSGDHDIVDAVEGKSIVVIALNFISAGDVVVNFLSTTTASYLAGPYTLFAGTGISMNENKYGHFKTVAGEALNMNTDAAIAVGGCLTYILV